MFFVLYESGSVFAGPGEIQNQSQAHILPFLIKQGGGGRDGVVVVIDPPWGDGFSFEKGLDLTRTEPPVREIIKRSISMFGIAAEVVFVIVTHEYTDDRSIQELAKSYPLLERGVTNELIDGSNAGYLICSTG